MKRICVFSCAFLIMMCFFGCSGHSKSDQSIHSEIIEFNIEEYKANVKNCVISVSDVAVCYGNVAQYQYSFIKSMYQLGGSSTVEGIVAASSKWHNKETGYTIADLNAKYDEHTILYKDIIMTEIEGKEAEEIENLFRKLFSSYIDLHNLVNDPSLNKNDYADEYNKIIDGFVNAEEELNIFLQ